MLVARSVIITQVLTDTVKDKGSRQLASLRTVAAMSGEVAASQRASWSGRASFVEA